MIENSLPLKPRETATSLLSRMAATYGVPTTDFARDMGVSYRKLAKSDRDAIEAVSALNGLTADAEDRLISWSGISAGNVRTLFRNETIVSRALKNPTVRGCPICLQEDALQNPREPNTAMAMRGDWQFRHVTACVKHSRPLVELWHRPNLFQRFDIQGRLSDISSDLLAGHLTKDEIELSSFDYWLEHRLENNQDSTWLSSESLFAASTFCHHLGQLLLRSQDQEPVPSVSIQRAGDALAFEIVKDGKEAIEKCLVDLIKQSTSDQHEPRKVFGSLYVTLKETYSSAPSFDIFRDILRSSIVNNFPLDAGTEVLGKVVRTRKLHSINSAATDAGVGARLMGKVLADIGAISQDDTHRPARTTFDAIDYASLISEISTWITKQKMKEVLGATKREFETLVAEDLISPATSVTSYAAVWRRRDALKFLNRLDELSREAIQDADQTMGLLQAHSLTRLSITEIIAMVERGEINLVKVRKGQGIRNYMLYRHQIKGLQPKKAPAAVKLGPSPAEFFRSIGLRDATDVKTLIDNDCLKLSRNQCSENGKDSQYLSDADVLDFGARLFTLTTLSKQTGRHRNSLRALLSKNGIKPLEVGGSTIKGLFSVADLAPRLKQELFRN